jgi:hypothetical protein
MNSKPSPWLALSVFAAFVSFAPAAAHAGTTAAAIAAGGIVPLNQTSVVIAREVVRISDRRVVVEYDLRNDSASDASADLAFLVPPYQNQWDAMDPAAQAFRSLKLFVDDKPVEYKAEAKAELNGLDITKTLEKARIDIATFGHLSLGRDQHSASRRVFVADYERLPEKERHRLRSEGIFKGEEGYSLYTVRLEYRWQQTIPAHATVHVRQEYKPVIGYTEAPPEADALRTALVSTSGAARTSSMAGGDQQNPLAGFCPNTRFVDEILKAHKAFAQTLGPGILPHWVDYDMLSGTAWRRPIEDFTLIVDIPQPEDGIGTLVSFCSPGVIDKHDGSHLEIHLSKFVPAVDLHIGFFNAPMEAPDTPVAASR